MADYPFTSNYTDTVPNVKDSMLKHDTSYTPSVAVNRGKHPIVAKTVTTIDVPHSEVAADFESRNNNATTSGRIMVAVDFGIAADFDLLGKVVADLQKDMGVSANNIIGTLKYVTGYTGFSGDPEEQEGNYLAFKVGYAGTYTRLTVQFDGKAEQTMDSDRTHVQLFKSAPVGKRLTVRAYNGDILVSSKVYDLSQIKLEAKA